MRIFTFLFFLIFLQVIGYTQCAPADINCDNTTSYILPETDNVEFLFDSFSKYAGGISQYGSTVLKLKVDNNPALTCRWKLSMIISNNGWVSADEWNSLATYGAGGGSKPTLDMLQIRISNGCNTAMPGVNNVWRTFAIPPGTGDIIDIINDPFPDPITPAGSCASQVNGAGTYLGLNYGEYSFTVDYQIIPGYNWIPGYYNLSIKFCLTE